MIEKLKKNEYGMVSDKDIISKIDELVNAVNGIQEYLDYSAGILNNHCDILNIIVEGIKKVNGDLEEV